MLRHLKSPAPYQRQRGEASLFLAGSIEMGAAEAWQERVAQACAGDSLCVLNPRRDDWDASWEQSIRNAQFREQVTWELAGLESADAVLLYLAPGTKSPISLLELGLRSGREGLFVCCPEGFWRKGNVELVCARYRIPLFERLEDAVGATRTYLRQLGRADTG
jgi:hypothetical protein